ncbi:MAG: LacI family DNA-binding transcriptional regulator [Bacillota bacterium]
MVKKVTIKDVADKAGVSPSTVSRVISDSSSISQPTKDKVTKIMNEMGYYPNAIARSLVKQKTRTIGLVMSRPTDRALANPFFSGVIQGIAAVAQEKNYSLLFAAADSYQVEYDEALKQLQAGRVDGLILLASRINDVLIKKLLEHGFPFVLIGRSQEYPDIPRVDNDNYEAAYSLAEKLLQSGYSKFAVLAGQKDYVFTGDRLAGVKDCLNSRNIQLGEEKVVYTDFTFDSARSAAAQLMERGDLEVLIAFDDLLALAAVQAAEALNVKVPQDLGIVGFNDQSLISKLHPALTTVRIPILTMGENAVGMLIRMLEEEDFQGEELIIPTEIVERETLRFD